MHRKVPVHLAWLSWLCRSHCHAPHHLELSEFGKISDSWLPSPFCSAAVLDSYSTETSSPRVHILPASEFISYCPSFGYIPYCFSPRQQGLTVKVSCRFSFCSSHTWAVDNGHCLGRHLSGIYQAWHGTEVASLPWAQAALWLLGQCLLPPSASLSTVSRGLAMPPRGQPCRESSSLPCALGLASLSCASFWVFTCSLREDSR